MSERANQPEVGRPDHPWNDPDSDGHDCVDCDPMSIWKCDRAAHPGGVLPALTDVPGLRLDSIDDLLSDDERKALNADLERMARQRRTAGGNLG